MCWSCCGECSTPSNLVDNCQLEVLRFSFGNMRGSAPGVQCRFAWFMEIDFVRIPSFWHSMPSLYCT